MGKLSATDMRAFVETNEFIRAVRLGRFDFTLRAETEAWLPRYKGSTLRGAFGSALKHAVCIRSDMDCEVCIVRPSCIYTQLFETLPPEGQKPTLTLGLTTPDTVSVARPSGSAFHGQQHAPRPFVLEPPLEEKQHYLPGERITFGLTLVGRAVDYLPYVIFAVDETGRRGLGQERGRFVLESVSCRTANGEDRLIYDSAEQRLASGPFSMTAEEFITQRLSQLFRDLGLRAHGSWPEPEIRDLKPESRAPSPEPRPFLLKLRFLTPTRIRVQGDLQSGVTFELLMKNILRRIWQVVSLHCGVESGFDHRRLIERAKGVTVVRSQLRWHDWERYSNRQGGPMKMGGFVGEMEFAGVDCEFLSVLVLGELFHVGTGTTMGLGKFEVSLARQPRCFEIRHNNGV
jgi:hypothetical protein